MTSFPFSLPVSVVALLLGFSLYSSCPPPVSLLLSRNSVDVLFLLSHTNQTKRETKQGHLIKPNAMFDTAKRKSPGYTSSSKRDQAALLLEVVEDLVSRAEPVVAADLEPVRSSGKGLNLLGREVESVERGPVALNSGGSDRLGDDGRAPRETPDEQDGLGRRVVGLCDLGDRFVRREGRVGRSKARVGGAAAGENGKGLVDGRGEWREGGGRTGFPCPCSTGRAWEWACSGGARFG